MKKLTVKLLALAMLFTVAAISLASCSQSKKLLRMDEAERAVAFYEMVEENGEKATSGSVKQKLYLKIDIGDVAYEQTSESTSTYVNQDGEGALLEQSVTTVWVGGEKTVTYTDEGYMNGMMFTYNKEGKAVSKLKSPITWEEYEAFRDNQMEDVPEIGVGEGFCTTMTCQQGDDGIWTATYEGFTEQGMKYFRYIIKGLETAAEAEHTLKDVRLTYVADKDLTPLSQKMEFIFDEKEDAETRVPVITAEMEITGLNNTVFSEEYDISDFTEVEDLRTVENFTSALNDRMNADSGAFTTTTKATAIYAGQNNKTTTVQNVTYKNHDGYEFTLDLAQEGYEISMAYKKGNVTTTVREEKTGTVVDSTTESMTEFEAQATVQQLMNSESISALDIIDVNIKDAENGIYRFTLGESVKNGLNEQYEMAYGSKIDTFRGHIEATVVEGKLMGYTYHVYTTLQIEGQSMSITVDYTVTFTDFVEDGEAA